MGFLTFAGQRAWETAKVGWRPTIICTSGPDPDPDSTLMPTKKAARVAIMINAPGLRYKAIKPHTYHRNLRNLRA